MSFASQMIHTCVIERDPTNGEDLHGNAPVGQVPQLIYTGRCRLVEKTERILTERAGRTAVTVFKLLIPANAAIEERDRVKSVTLEDATVLTDAFIVKNVIARRAASLRHLSIDLERVS